MWPKRKARDYQTRLPRVCSARLTASLRETPLDLDQFVDQAQNKDETVLYLAYGSNLCNETFRGRRGIKPVAQINVQVPSLQVTFDLPGIPYVEPCFANSGRRDPDHDVEFLSDTHDNDNETTSLLDNNARKSGYRKDEWRKGLVGVVYEVTAQDYAHIIATEGGGASYQDILVDCYPFANDDPSEPVPQTPTSPPFKAHTLFAPSLPPDEPPPEKGGRVQRPDKSYAQASARYLKLIKDGAAELGLPYEYQDYLNTLRPYRITTLRQRLGQVAFLSLWAPIVGFAFGLSKIFVDDKGRIPAWLRQFTGTIFVLAWKSYDRVYKPIFGDGERSLGDEAGEHHMGTSATDASQNGGRLLAGQPQMSELDKSRQPAQLV